MTPIQQLMTAVREGTADEFRRTLAEFPDLLGEHGPSILEYSAALGRVDVAAILVESGVDVNGEVLLSTPLGEAAGKGGVEMVRWLLDHGANVNKRVEPRGSTPLEEAIVGGRLEVVEVLLERGADPDILHGNPPRNALASAKFWGRAEIAACLESKGVAEVVIKPKPLNVETRKFLAPGRPTNPAKWFEEKWGPVAEYEREYGLDALSRKNWVLFLVGYLIDQLADGGAEMVYFNPSANYAQAMPDALDEIGASRAAAAIRAINALIPGGPSARVGELGLDEIDQALPSEAAALGNELEAIFDEWLPDGGERVMVSQLYTYYRS